MMDWIFRLWGEKMKSKDEHFVTCGQMKILEKRADEDGLSYYQMMENAGTAAASVIMEGRRSSRLTAESAGMEEAAEPSISVPAYMATAALQAAVAEAPAGIAAAASDAGASDVRERQALVFCGKGNNGGDGFVVARKMKESGFDVHVILVDGFPVTEDSLTNFRLLEKMSVKITDMNENERVLMDMRAKPDIIVDAIYGTGFHGSLSGNALRAAIYMNRFRTEGGSGTCGIVEQTEFAAAGSSRPMIFALDIPSGLGGDMVDERDVDSNSVRADCTIAFHARKPVHLQRFAEPYCGFIVVADIGIDEERLWNV